ncbi:SAM-dependent methyltransferase [Mycobacterium asiaticum]|uniref:S-adenosyl-L-methionine-dependent methyltransferase n=1 Tax=Mycobacterium asiaticum TaxID=1790 RepID=A0A1A3N9H7_MYCAS|nr:class I SAM-dependent methyltransferase [Mycobacterium asiaticum]OBK17714.1 SAM-dependent methyltransferase [Mycobacterium asiaticum]
MVREDGDTWDQATGVGITATFSAVARAVATQKGLINDPFAEPLVRAAGIEYFSRLIEDQQYATDGGDNPMVSGMINVLAVHGRFLDDFLSSAAQSGIRQVVNLGAGLDTRAFRLWWPSGTTVYELDQPRVVDFRDHVLRGLGAKLTTNRCVVGVDLRDDWFSALQRVGFDPTERAVWVAENLFVGYLPPDAQDRLLRQVSSASVAGSWFAADHLPWTPAQLQEGHAFFDGWRRGGLDIDLAKITYAAEFRSVSEYLAAHGWLTTDRTLVDLRTAIGLGRRGVTSHDLSVTPRYVTAALAAGGDGNGSSGNR